MDRKLNRKRLFSAAVDLIPNGSVLPRYVHYIGHKITVCTHYVGILMCAEEAILNSGRVLAGGRLATSDVL